MVSDQWVILQTPPQPVIEGDTVTLRCRVRYNSHITRVVFYKDNEELQSRTDTELSVDRVSKSDEGSYKCRAWRNASYLGESAEMRVSVRELPQTTLTLEPPFPEIFTGETVTLRCGVEGGSAGWKYLWYKDSEDTPVLQTAGRSITGDSYTITAAALSDQGQYCCRGQRGDQPCSSQCSDPVTLTVSALFSRVTLTASPGATVKEGEALNLTCEAAVNKTPRPELHYTIVRDGEPVTNSTDSALYSIASTEKSHTGSYTCAVESQGVKKSSQELHIELQSSPCLAGGKSRKTSDQDQEQSAEGIELSSRVQHTGVELE
ncbi:low affinity immunoglobulin gamma Fc region receptor III-like [Acipenser ruthenus]|uniref:low affinity immunoglobulin gamma Fc region receptor III-like n=1 Tax=Acipenser ruthenus TaxID=7906 RepID=UPI002740B3F6|nr:low affinity immunoglobulin gamma Fc region receptor III-like [Acipenser ruthenus]